MTPPSPEPVPVGRFGKGESAALAKHLKAHFVVNEQPAKAYAGNLGLKVTTVPAVIVALFAQGIITEQAARKKLEIVEPNTAPEIISEALLAIEALSQE